MRGRELGQLRIVQVRGEDIVTRLELQRLVVTDGNGLTAPAHRRKVQVRGGHIIQPEPVQRRTAIRQTGNLNGVLNFGHQETGPLDKVPDRSNTAQNWNRQERRGVEADRARYAEERGRAIRRSWRGVIRGCQRVSYGRVDDRNRQTAIDAVLRCKVRSHAAVSCWPCNDESGRDLGQITVWVRTGHYDLNGRIAVRVEEIVIRRI